MPFWGNPSGLLEVVKMYMENKLLGQVRTIQNEYLAKYHEAK